MRTRTAGLARGRGLPLVAAALSFYAAVAVVPSLYVSGWLASKALGDERFGRSVRAATELAGAPTLTDRLVTSVQHASPGSLVAALLISALYGEGFFRAGRAVSASQWRGTAVVRARLMALPLLLTFAVVVTLSLLALDVYGDHRPLRDIGVLDGYLIFLGLWLGATLIIAMCYLSFVPARAGALATLVTAAAAGSWIAGSAIGYRLVLALPLNLGSPFFGAGDLGAAVLALSWIYLGHLAIAAGRLALEAGLTSSRARARTAAGEATRP